MPLTLAETWNGIWIMRNDDICFVICEEKEIYGFIVDPKDPNLKVMKIVRYEEDGTYFPEADLDLMEQIRKGSRHYEELCSTFERLKEKKEC